MAYAKIPNGWQGCVVREDVWLSWGKLVREWVTNPASRPKDLTEFRKQLADNMIPMMIPDSANEVEFVDYDDKTVYVPLPSEKMITMGQDWMKAIADKGDGKGKYPLPSFYQVAFGSQEVDMTLEELQDFNLRRIGEYTINLCG